MKKTLTPRYNSKRKLIIKLKHYCEVKVMFIYIILEGASNVEESKEVLEKTLKKPILIVNYDEVSIEMIEELKPLGIISSGSGIKFQDFELTKLYPLHEVIKKTNIPILCICASHQLLSYFYSENIYESDKFYDRPIRELNQDENLPRFTDKNNIEYWNHFKAYGFFRITLKKADPLFKGLSEEPFMKCNHYCEIKKLPNEFELLASSRNTAIEAMKHKEKPLYGVQFHPECAEEPFVEGIKLLENFKAIAVDFRENKETSL